MYLPTHPQFNQRPQPQYDLSHEIISNLSNLARIPTQYYDYESGLKLLHSLAQIEYKCSLNKDTLPLNPSYPLNEQEFVTSPPNSSLKRHSSFSLDHYYKGVYKLRRFEQTNNLKLEALAIQIENKVNFIDLIPKSSEDTIEPIMLRLISLHIMLFDKKLQKEDQTYYRDGIILKAFQKNIYTLLKTGLYWLNQELLRDLVNPIRYHQILDKMLEVLNQTDSIKQILTREASQDIIWIDFIMKIPLYTNKVFLHMSLICESVIVSGVSRPAFLETFKKVILNNLEKKEFCYYGLNLFLNLINRDAFGIVNKSFWPIVEFQEFIVSSAEKALEAMKTSSSGSENLYNTDSKVRDYTIKYLHVLSKKPSMIEKLIASFSELAPIAQQVLLDKFEILAKERFLDYVSVDAVLKLFKSPKNNEKLIIKFIERYRKEPESLQGMEQLLLPEISRFCIENSFLNGLTELICLNNDEEFKKNLNQLFIMGNEQFFNELIPILFEKNKNLAEILFKEIHSLGQKADNPVITPETSNLVLKIHESFFRNDKTFFEKEDIIKLLNEIVEEETVHSIIMKTIHKIFQIYYKRGEKEEILDSLVGIVAKLIERNLMDNEKIWTGMKFFFKLDLRKCKDLLQSLPENYKRDFFKE